MGFQCKQFYLKDDHCAMKVSTDSLLLGSWLSIRGNERALDMGTGCGILALMATQRGAHQVVAIELDKLAAAQAADNVQASPWPTQVTVIQADVVQWCSNTPERFDLVVSSPPYFSHDLASGSRERELARQGTGAVWREWLSAALHVLKPQGRIALVLPQQRWSQVKAEAEQLGLHVQRYCQVFTTLQKPVKLLLVEFSREEVQVVAEQLVIHALTEGQMQYTDEFRELTGAFYLKG